MLCRPAFFPPLYTDRQLSLFFFFSPRASCQLLLLKAGTHGKGEGRKNSRGRNVVSATLKLSLQDLHDLAWLGLEQREKERERRREREREREWDLLMQEERMAVRWNGCSIKPCEFMSGIHLQKRLPPFWQKENRFRFSSSRLVSFRFLTAYYFALPHLAAKK